MKRLKQQKVLTSLKELLEAYGSSTPGELGRSLYKYTGCGPWTAFVVKEKQAETIHYNLEVVSNPDGSGVVLKNHKIHPEFIISLLGFNTDGHARKVEHPGYADLGTYLDLLEKFIKDQPGSGVGRNQEYRVTDHKAAAGCIRITVTHNIPEQYSEVYYQDDKANVEDWETAWGNRCTAVKVGSIVEGSDVYVGPEQMDFPFTENQFGEMVKGIDEEAGFYWNRDNSDWYNILRYGVAIATVRYTWGDVIFEDGEKTIPKSVVKKIRKVIVSGQYSGDYCDRPQHTINSRWSISRFTNDTIF